MDLDIKGSDCSGASEHRLILKQKWHKIFALLECYAA